MFNLQLQQDFCKFIKIKELQVILDSNGFMEQEDILKELTSRFPEYESQILELLIKSNDFREILEDYQFCRHKLIKLSGNPSENNSLIRHYEKTLLELEDEVKGYLSIEK